MSRPIRFIIFLSLSILCLGAAGWLTVQQINRYNTEQGVFPPGTTIAGVQVSSLDAKTARERITELYIKTPIQLMIEGADGSQIGSVQLDPASLGQQVDIDGMLRAAEMIQSQQPYWPGFWGFLMNQAPSGFQAPLACTVAEEQLRAGLKAQVSAHYEQPPTPAQPTPGDILYQPGKGGQTLNIEGALESIKTALCSPTQRTAKIQLQTSGPLPPDPNLLGSTMEAIAQASGYDGLIELYYQNLSSGQEINFAMNQGKEIQPGVSFTAASTIKIPVMVSAYAKIEGEPSKEVKNRMGLMIDRSDNASTDEVMKLVLDPNIAPVQVTQDMQSFGLQNTFLAGLFAPGSPLLNQYQTPANTRTDITTQPDIYNQTTAADMGRLLAGIYHCAQDGSGPLISTFQGKVTQAECQAMVDLLLKNRKGVLIEGGLPEGTPIAHKYGWILDTTDDLMHTASDAAIVYTDQGDFVLTVYLYHPDQLQWDDAQQMVARMTTGLINFYRAK